MLVVPEQRRIIIEETQTGASFEDVHFEPEGPLPDGSLVHLPLFLSKPFLFSL